jgi:hypothetical protein
MEFFSGLDVGMDETAICVVNLLPATSCAGA